MSDRPAASPGAAQSAPDTSQVALLRGVAHGEVQELLGGLHRRFAVELACVERCLRCSTAFRTGSAHRTPRRWPCGRHSASAAPTGISRPFCPAGRFRPFAAPFHVSHPPESPRLRSARGQGSGRFDGSCRSRRAVPRARLCLLLGRASALGFRAGNPDRHTPGTRPRC